LAIGNKKIGKSRYHRAFFKITTLIGGLFRVTGSAAGCGFREFFPVPQSIHKGNSND